MFSVDEIIKATSARLVKSGSKPIIKGISIDTRTIKPGFVFMAIKGENFDGHDFIPEAIKKGAVGIIKEARHKKSIFLPGKKKPVIFEVRNTIVALGDLARFRRRQFALPVIAVTGSNGKTTTKEMIAHALSPKFNVLKNEGTKNNHIGLPMTLLNLKPEHDIAVLEIGTSHFGEVEYLTRICEPNAGVITNIGQSHLEYFHNLKGVFDEKSSLLNNLSKPGIAFLNTDDRFLKKKAAKMLRNPRFLSFGINARADFLSSRVQVHNNQVVFFVNAKFKFTLATPGYYNIYNALAAVAVGRIFGMGYYQLSSSLSDFDFPAGRLKVRKIGKLTFIDDTYNSNPLSLKAALTALKNIKAQGRRIFIMGDMLELGREEEAIHTKAGQQIKSACDIFVGVGKLSGLSARTALKCGFKKENVFICSSSQEAKDILLARIKAKPQDLILVKGSRMTKMEKIF